MLEEINDWWRNLALTGVLGLTLGACTVTGDTTREEILLPEQWPEALQAQMAEAESAQEDWRQWWQRYEDPALDALVERVLDENLELRLQAARIREARAQLGLREAERWPMLSAQADAAREQQSQASFFASLAPPEFGGIDALNQFSLTGVLSWEADLWGRLAQQEDAAAAMLEQTVFGADAVRLNLITETVNLYFNLRAAQQQLRIAEQTLASREESLELEQLRFESGAVDRFSVSQANVELEAVRVMIPGLRTGVARAENALAVLAGYEAGEMMGSLDFGDTELTELVLPDALPAVMPSEMLERRPDLRAAEAALRGAEAGVGVARAARLPSLNLSAMLGTAAMDTSDLFTAPAQTWNLGANLAGPLFDFGRLAANVDSAEAMREQAELQYRLNVNQAFAEVRDALTVHESAEQRVAAVRRQREAIAETVELAELQYQEGAISYYELLDARRMMLEADLQLSDVMGERLAASATLFKTLGGGW